MVAADAIGPLVNARDHLRLLASPSHDDRACAHAPGGGALPTPRLAVDEIDAQLLRLLQADARMPNMKLAEAVNLSPASVHERVRRLMREGFILGYEAVLNPALLGTGMLVFAEIRVEGRAHGAGEAFRAAVQVRSEILECHEVTGSFDFLIKTRVSDMLAYRDLVASVVWTLPGVRDVRTYAVIEEVKSTSRIPL